MKTLYYSSFMLLIAGILTAFILGNHQIKPDVFSPVPFQNLTVTGEIYTRAMRNMDRLEEEKYHPDRVFLTDEESNGWPGDTEGRTVLALTLDAQVTKRTPTYLNEILKRFPDHMNDKGYFGVVYNDTICNEQQLASHGWVLRGLCEYYLWKKDQATLAMIKNVVKNLGLRTAGYHSKYPVDPEKRNHGGTHSGTSTQQQGNWILSTDTGCDHIFLDGLTQAYEIVPSPELEALIEEMIEVFFKIDQVKIKAQTHATLTALRALLRWYHVTGRKSLLTSVEEKFNLYKAEGMTENFENYNWFGRPEWTEPCAVVDSYIVAVSLWRYTGNPVYLEDAHHIYYNGLALEQRANGGFGIQSCSGSKNSAMIASTLEEAHWCCTMRGGEGLSRAAQYSFFTKGFNEIAVPFFQNAEVKLFFNSNAIKLKEETGYPFSAKTTLTIIESEIVEPVTFHIFIPSWIEKVKLKVNGKTQAPSITGSFLKVVINPKKGSVIEIDGKQKFFSQPVRGNNAIKGYTTFNAGPLILSYIGNEEISIPAKSSFTGTGNGIYKGTVNGKEIILKPLYHMMLPEVSHKAKYQSQVLFKQQ